MGSRNFMFVFLVVVLGVVLNSNEIQCRISKRQVTGRDGVCKKDQLVYLRQGLLRGECGETSSRRRLCWFQGVPYAQAPLGELRFKDPEPPEDFEDEYDATIEKSVCPQYDIDYVNTDTTNIIGNEDCLYLNVYRPCMDYESGMELLPVMVWIYGGGHSWGSGNRRNFGPDYLVEEGLIVVTFNYRMGPLGFLYMEEAAPGNAGMKDQVQVLRWVRDNIEAFGGDPDRVTIFGSGSGAADVQMHQHSKMSEGLFSAVISQGGNALNKWAMQDNPLDYSNRLAQAVGCKKSDKEETVECLRGIDVDTLLEKVAAESNKDKTKIRAWPSDFAPTVDYPVDGVEPFLTKPMYELVTSQEGKSYPTMAGINDMETMIFLAKYNFFDQKVQKEVEDSFKDIILSELIFPIDSQRADEAVKSVKDFYMDGKELSNSTMDQFFNLLNNLFFGGMDYALSCRMRQPRTVTYTYLFTIDGKLNFVKPRLPIQLPGACHDDNIGYLFAVDGRRVRASSDAAQKRREIVETWAEFAKYQTIGSWEPYEQNSRLTNIIGETQQTRRVRQNDFDFWVNFYDTYAKDVQKCNP